jgi:phosphoglycerate dehydrogenase-like enzyme
MPSATRRLAILDDYQGVAMDMADWSRLTGSVDITIFRDHLSDGDALVQRLQPFEMIAAMRERTPFPREILERLPNLRLLVTSGLFNAAIDMEAARDRGIVVSGTASRHGLASTIELTWALILACTRSLIREDALVRAGGWQSGLGTILHGRTLGIVGLGNLGSRMIPVAQAFGMNVVAWSRNLTPARAGELGVTALDHDAFFASADIITVHLKYTAASAGYIGKTQFDLMQPHTILINTSRGPVVDEAALIDALDRGTIAGAGLDVYDIEPLPLDHRLRSIPNAVLSPHMGYVTEQAYRDYFGGYVEAIEAYLAGSPTRVLNGD